MKSRDIICGAVHLQSSLPASLALEFLGPPNLLNHSSFNFLFENLKTDNMFILRTLQRVQGFPCFPTVIIQNFFTVNSNFFNAFWTFILQNFFRVNSNFSEALTERYVLSDARRNLLRKEAQILKKRQSFCRDSILRGQVLETIPDVFQFN